MTSPVAEAQKTVGASEDSHDRVRVRVTGLTQKLAELEVEEEALVKTIADGETADALGNVTYEDGQRAADASRLEGRKLAKAPPSRARNTPPTPKRSTGASQGSLLLLRTP